MNPGRARVLRGGHWAGLLLAATDRPPGDPAAWMEHHTRLLKRDRYSRVGLLELGGELNYLKFYRHKSLLQRVGFQIGSSSNSS